MMDENHVTKSSANQVGHLGQFTTFLATNAVGESIPHRDQTGKAPMMAIIANRPLLISAVRLFNFFSLSSH